HPVQFCGNNSRGYRGHSVGVLWSPRPDDRSAHSRRLGIGLHSQLDALVQKIMSANCCFESAAASAAWLREISACPGWKALFHCEINCNRPEHASPSLQNQHSLVCWPSCCFFPPRWLSVPRTASPMISAAPPPATNAPFACSRKGKSRCPMSV